MRTVQSGTITEKIKKLYIDANIRIDGELLAALKKAHKSETSRLPKYMLGQIVQNCEIAARTNRPICQDTGLAVVFLEIGQQVRIAGGDLAAAVNSGVAEACRAGYLRQSVLDPLTRKNSGNNSPAIIYTRITSGSRIKLTVIPKGFGSENMGQVKMLKPGAGTEGIIDFVTSCVKTAGANPCPPMVIGVGIGGTMDYAALLAKEALFGIGSANNKREKALASKLLNKINRLGIGPAGLGGKTTALGVRVKTFPTHIAGLPVAVNTGCWCHRARTAII